MLNIKLMILSVIFFISPMIAQDIGSEAPAFTLQSLDHGEISLSDYGGKVVFLFFLGNQCPPCYTHSQIIQTDIVNQYSAEDVQVLGLDVWSNSATRLPGFKNITGVTFPLLKDAQSLGYANYEITTQDYSIIVNQQGIIVGRYNTYSSFNINTLKAKIDESLITTNIEDNPSSPYTFKLQDNFPNPFNPSTTIPFSIDKPQYVILQIYNITGKLVKTIVEAPFAAGQYSFKWDGKNKGGNPVSSGIYFSRLTGNSQIQVKQLMLVK